MALINYICHVEEKLKNKQKLIDFWITGADDDYETMEVMLNSKRYHWSLFAGHLMLEKLLKALYVKINEEYPPFTHNLLKLAEDCNIELSENLKFKLVTITAFNINARYDDYKRSFYNKCTPDFTSQWTENINEIKAWIEKQLK